MYDYATQNLQRQQITELQQVNDNLEILNTTINNTGILLASLITIILIKELIKKCLGGK